MKKYDIIIPKEISNLDSRIKIIPTVISYESYGKIPYEFLLNKLFFIKNQ